MSNISVVLPEPIPPTSAICVPLFNSAVCAKTSWMGGCSKPRGSWSRGNYEAAVKELSSRGDGVETFEKRPEDPPSVV